MPTIWAIAFAINGILAVGAGHAKDTDHAIHWQALSRTASAITGDIALTDAKLRFGNGAWIGLTLLERDVSNGIALYRILDQANPPLLNGNRLCGAEPPDYLTTHVAGDASGQRELSLHVYRYAGQLKIADLPLRADGPPEQSLCAIYNYALDDRQSPR